jgi:hypothetical protein
MSLALVWPLGGVGLLLVALAQARFVDRFARLRVVRAIFLGYSLVYVVTLVLFATDVPQKVPATLAWLLADQMNFLLPLVLWTLAGDVFTSGQGITVFPRISRWLFGGQVLGLALSVAAPAAFDSHHISLAWLLVAPPVIGVLVATLLPRALKDATTGLGATGEQSIRASVNDAVKFIRELPAYRWMFWAGLFAILGGTMVDFGFLHLSGHRFTEAGTLQAMYAGTSLGCFVLCFLLQQYGTASALNKFGVARVLQLLPIGALLGSLALVVGGATRTVALGAVALVLWRLPRWSIDGSARQTAMASLPDERRLRSSFLIDMTPLALSLIVAAGPIALAAHFDNFWIAPAIGAVLAVVGLVLSRHTVRTWDDTQLSYRLKRRKRLG